MSKFIILFVVGYIVYRMLKSWIGQGTQTRRQTTGPGASGQIDDVMVKDPFCEVYFPKRNAVVLNRNGSELYFCSTECRDKYLSLESKENE